MLTGRPFRLEARQKSKAGKSALSGHIGGLLPQTRKNHILSLSSVYTLDNDAVHCQGGLLWRHVDREDTQESCRFER